MSHRHYHRLLEAIVIAWITDRARRRYGMSPVALIGLGIAAFWVNPCSAGPTSPCASHAVCCGRSCASSAVASASALACSLW
jgi:hypothetical protein